MLALALAVAAGCGGDEDASEPAAPKAGDRPVRSEAQRREWRPELEPLSCPEGAGNCRAATGEVVYVEAVDPDGDGDAHFVLLSKQSVTAPGISVIDVAAELRPQPLPRIGDTLSAAGPVYRGSFGQRQIQAERLRVAR